MNAKTEKQIEKALSQRFGCEIEMNHITRRKAAKVAAEFFGTGIYKDTSATNGYKTWSAWDGKGREWKFSKDVSISGREDEQSELVSPILTYDDMEELQELVRRLRKAGAISHAGVGAAIHVHVDGAGHTAKSIRNLANIMASHELLIVEALEIDEVRLQRYCKLINPVFLAKLNAQKPESMAELADIWYTTHHAENRRNAHYNQSRYAFLNLHSLFTKGTVEFRGYEFLRPGNGKKNGIHAGRLKTVIQLSLLLSQMAKELKTASPKEQQHENPAFAMRTWLIRLGMVGEEFATARKLLTEKLCGNSAWRHETA
jgi:hypothetical protein